MSTSRIRIDAVSVGVAAVLIAAAFVVQNQFTARAQESSRQVAPQQKPPTPILDTHHLMELFNRPMFEYLKKSVAEKPSDEKGWKEISNRGLQVAEVANLVALRERTASQDQWIAMAGDLQRSGIHLSEAAASGDWAATQEAYGKVVKQCNSCHQASAPERAPRLEP